MRTSSKMSLKDIKKAGEPTALDNSALEKQMEKLLEKFDKMQGRKRPKMPELPEMDQILKELREGRRKGGTVSRKKGSKIMQGYKAGGSV
jgi:hypothetical protein